MKKRIRRRTPDEVRTIINKKYDDMQHNSMTPEQRKAWERKLYGLNGKK